MKKYDDCILCNKHTKECKVLDHTPCKFGECSFYKSKREYEYDENNYIKRKDDNNG